MKFLVHSIWVLAVISGFAFFSTAVQPARAQATNPTAGPSPSPTSWVISNLSAGATQLQRGQEVYNLVCSACHAYDGTGLTDQWRSTWDPRDQNCWQSKCHATNHPEDGFFMPASPPLVGPFMPARFKTASTLHDFIITTMPWQNPKSLTREDGWALTAYVMKLNGMAPPDNLNDGNAAGVSIQSSVTLDPALKLSIPPGSQKSPSSPAASAAPAPSPTAQSRQPAASPTAQVSAPKPPAGQGFVTPAVILGGAVLLILVGVLLYRSKR